MAGHARRWAATLVRGLDIRIRVEGVSQGISVVVFPEGTTTRGPGLLPFKKGIFHMASDRGIPVVPVSITYEDPEVAWTGNDFFTPHFLRIFKSSPLRATLVFGPTLSDKDGSRLRDKAQARVARQLALRETPLPN